MVEEGQIDLSVIRKSEDFSFMRRKVRVNMVESLIQEYALEEDEIQAKKWKNKKYL